MPRPASLADLFLGFLRLGCTAFGGPAMVPYIRDLAVRKRAWLTEDVFRLGMALCQAVPGATAMQMAAYVGLRARGLPGALAAYLGFGLPAFVLITALSAVYHATRDAAAMTAAFQGLKLVVVALVANAAADFTRKFVSSRADTAIALGVGLMVGLRGNPILAILGACAAGLVVYGHEPPGADPGCCNGGSPLRRLAALGLGLAAATGLLALLRPDLLELAWVMFKVDLFAFGGGYASLPLMLHETTTARAWMSPEVFMDGLALGQITPGPIVITSAFVGYHLAGFAGALTGAVFAFTPSLFVLTAATPYFDRMQASPLFRRAVRASLASLAGLMAAVFARFAVDAPFSLPGALLCVAAFLALRRGVDILWVVLAGAAMALLFG
ncbi:chromate efflux transporter [Desulfocurvus sp. DL9XJH121]